MRVLLLLCLFVLGLTFGSARAAVILLVDANGKLTGAQDVPVDGILYDVSFRDGSCVDLFSGCNDSADFAFPTATSATNASLALSSLVFTGLFDTNPRLTSGCEFGTQAAFEYRCLVLIPYRGRDSFFFDRSGFQNGETEVRDSVSLGEDGINFADSGLSGGENVVWALWTPSSERPVSEPATALVLGAAILALLVTRRRHAS